MGFLPEATQDYSRVAIKVISKIDNTAIGNAPSVTVDYNGKTYSTLANTIYSDTNGGNYVYDIYDFSNISSSVTVNCHVSCDGYSTATVQTQTVQNDFSNPTEVFLYPVTINGQIQRLSDAKQKFVDAFPTILKKEDSIENYPKMMEQCVPFFLTTYTADIFKIKEANIEAKGLSTSMGYIPSDCAKITLTLTSDTRNGRPLDFAIGKYLKNYRSGFYYPSSYSITGKTGDVYTIDLGEGNSLKDVAYFAATADIVCLIKNTLITLSDGTKKYVQDITFDDELLVWDFYEGRFSKAKPMFIKKAELADEYNLCRFSDGTELGLVGSDGYHRIWNNEANEFTHTGKPETPNGTHTFNERGERPELVSQEIIHEPVEFYNIITEKHYNLFANGILTSKRWSNRYGIKDMKYVLDDERMSEEHVNEMIDDMRKDPVWMYNKKFKN